MAKIPTLDQVTKLLGTYSIASVRNWLKRRGLTHSATTRDELAQRVYKLLEEEKLSHDELIQGMIGIEEASSKRTFLYSIPHSPSDLAKIDKQLKDLRVALANVRIQSLHPGTTAKIVYVINDAQRLRAKWHEVHTRVKAIRKNRTFSEIKVPKLIVLVIDKKTGLAQLRFDAPEDEHGHPNTAEPTTAGYFADFKETAENLIGLPLEPVELRSSLEKVIKTEPRLVEVTYFEDEAADGIYTKRAQKQKGKDVRDSSEVKAVLGSPSLRTYEGAPLRWLIEMSDGTLQRKVPSYVDAANGMIRFDADCYEEEIDYVLSQLV